MSLNKKCKKYTLIKSMSCVSLHIVYIYNWDSVFTDYSTLLACTGCSGIGQSGLQCGRSMVRFPVCYKSGHPPSQSMSTVPGIPNHRNMCLSTEYVMPHNGPQDVNCMKCQTEGKRSYEHSGNATQPAIILKSSEISRAFEISTVVTLRIPLFWNTTFRGTVRPSNANKSNLIFPTALRVSSFI